MDALLRKYRSGDMFEERKKLEKEDERLLDVGIPLHVLDRASAPGCESVFIEREGDSERRTQTEPLGADQPFSGGRPYSSDSLI